MKDKKTRLVALLAALTALAFVGGCSTAGGGGSSSSEAESSSSSAPVENEQDNGYQSTDWALSGNPSDFYFLDKRTNRLQTAFAETQRTVEQGEFVTFSAPLVLDGKGNLLSVKATIKSNGTGEAIAPVNGGFFAEEVGGYSIEYSFSVNGAQKTVTTVVSLRNGDKYVDESWVVETLGLFTALPIHSVDLTSKTYDIESSMTEEEKAKLDAFENVEWLLVNSVGERWDLTSTILDFNQIKPANYVVLGKTTEGGESRYVFSKNYDFFDEEVVEWNSMENEEYFRVYNESENTKVSFIEISETEFAQGRSGKYAKIESGLTGESEEYSFLLTPYHKDYSRYEAQQYQIKFDVYFTATDPDRTITQTGTKEWRADEGKVNRYSGNVVNKWITFSLPLSEYQKGWSTLLTVEAVFYPPYESDFHADYSATYVGNVRMVPGIQAVEGEGEYLVDVKGKTTVDLKDYITDAGKALVANYEPTYILSSTDGKRKAEYATSVLSVNDLDLRNYELSVRYGEETLLYFGTTVDFYDSNEAPTLGDVGKLYKSNDPTQSTGFLGYGSPDEETKDGFMITDLTGEAKFRILPRHGKAYYEKFAKYTLSYSMYTRSQTFDDKTVSFIKHGYFGVWDQSGNTVGKWYSVDDKLQDDAKTVQWLLDNWDDYTSGNLSLYTFGGFVGFEGEGSSYATENITFYIGKFKMEENVQGVTEESAHLVNVNALTTLDLHDYLSEESLNAIGEFGNASYVLTPVSGEAKTFTSNVVALSELSKQAHELTVLYKGEKVLSKGTVIDLYDPDDQVVLGYESINANYAGGMVEANATASDGTTGVFKFTGVSESDKYWGVKPIHSKAYYELYKDYALTYDIYTDKVAVDGVTAVHSARHNYFTVYGVGADGGNSSWGKWFDVSKKDAKTVQWLVDNWDDYNAGKTGLYGSLCSARVGENDSSSAEQMAQVVFYIKVRVYLSVTEVTDTATHLVNVNGKTTVDLKEYVTEAGKAAIAQYGKASYLLTPTDGSAAKTFGDAVVNLSELDEKAYVLSVLYDGGAPMYSGTVVDLYDPADGGNSSWGKWFDVSKKDAKTVQWLVDNWDNYNAGTTGLYGSLCFARVGENANASAEQMAQVVFYIKLRIEPVL